ncbi:Uncharacterised protein [Legionella maceachernii]|nr:hypothetical protein SAMN02745128_00333 [Legionella maceachernii]SUP03664.1 Uncharacterised protein [Legionella maceachernii]
MICAAVKSLFLSILNYPVDTFKIITSILEKEDVSIFKNYIEK